jgi:hypothetical protein
MAKIDANIKMYRVGELGDCFLIHFTDGTATSSVLIDCGSFRNGGPSVDRMKAVVEDIKTQQKLAEGRQAPFDVVIGTHQHNDHLSGFVHAQEIFTEIGMKEVWLSWLDDPNDDKATLIANGQRKLVDKLQNISALLPAKFKAEPGAADTGEHDKERHTITDHINDVLGFYGLAAAAAGGPPVVPQDGISNLKALGKKVSYLSPGQILNLPGLAPGAVKVYVLGPPRDNELLFDINPGKGESYESKLTAAANVADGLHSALTNLDGTPTITEEAFFPFDNKFTGKLTDDAFVNSPYKNPDNQWRAIDLDWLDQTEQLALYLDTYTNNSSLVLAFELVEAKKVLLFVGDAQTGNWLSWKTVQWDDPAVKLEALLQKTVLYKVGHHGSHNATLPEYLEKMNHPDLVAMIPVDKSDPNITKPKGWKMPADSLYSHLKQQTNYRILRMDGQYEPDCDPQQPEVQKKWGGLFANIDDKPAFVGYTVKG